MNTEAMALTCCCNPVSFTYLPKEEKAAWLCGRWDVAMPLVNISCGSLPHARKMYSPDG